jgi:hypothetical protein
MAFVNMFAHNLQVFFETVKNDREIDSKLEQYALLLGMDKNQLYDMSKLNINIDEEIISCTKSFAQTKGTSVPFDFVANLLENENLDPGISPIGDINVFDHIDPLTGEPKVLSYEVESSLHNVVFNKAVKPLVHPVGFDVIYTRVLKLMLNDYFNLEVENYGYNIVVKQRNGKTYKWKDELDSSGNVINTVVKKFDSFLNEYGIEELDIRFMSGERLYRTTNGDLVYYDEKHIPHKWSKKFYDLEYGFKKRITVLTKEVKIDHHWSYVNDTYDDYYDKTTEVIIKTPVRDFTHKVDHIDDFKSLEDIKDYQEPDLTDHKTSFRPEQFPIPAESSVLDVTKWIWLNNPRLVGTGPDVGTFRLGDPRVKLGKDEEEFWVDLDYYINNYYRILSEANVLLDYNEDLMFTYATREGRRRIGKWKGFSDKRKEKDCRDVPLLEGAELRAKITSIKNEIYDNKKSIQIIQDSLDKVYSSQEELYFVIQGKDMIDDWLVVETENHSNVKYFESQMTTDDALVHTTVVFNMANQDGMTVGNDRIGTKPIGYEDSVSTDDGAGIYTYVINLDGSYRMTDYMGFIGDVLSLDSEIISDYNVALNKLDEDIVILEERINNITGVWGVYERTKCRLERNDLIKTKEAVQVELNNVLNKYI